MCHATIAGWVISMGNDHDFVTYHIDIAHRASRRNYLTVSHSGLDIDKQTVTTESGEKFLIQRTRFSGNGFNLKRA